MEEANNLLDKNLEGDFCHICNIPDCEAVAEDSSFF